MIMVLFIVIVILLVLVLCYNSKYIQTSHYPKFRDLHYQEFSDPDDRIITNLGIRISQILRSASSRI